MKKINGADFYTTRELAEVLEQDRELFGLWDWEVSQ